MNKLIATIRNFANAPKTTSYFLILLHVAAHDGHPQKETTYKGTYLFCQRYTYLLTYVLTYLLHGAESFLRS